MLVIVVFIIVFLCSRIVSLASICAGSSFPIFTLILNTFDYVNQSSAAGPTTLFYVVSTVVIAALQASILVYKHRANIQRLRAGEEKKITVKKKS